MLQSNHYIEPFLWVFRLHQFKKFFFNVIKLKFRGTPFPSQPLYDNVEMMRLSALVSPPPTWAKVQLVNQSSQPPSDFYLTATNVDEPQEVAYYTTATLPSGASLRRSGYNLSGKKFLPSSLKCNSFQH